MTVVNGNECLVCSPSCRTCSTSTHCTSCYPTNYLYNGTCSISCPNTTYPDSALQQCLSCVAPCSQCSSPAYCITCINTALVIENGQCLAACTGYLISINGVCTACNAACLSCVGTVTHCVVCQTGYYYVAANSTCVNVCNGYIYDNRTATGNY